MRVKSTATGKSGKELKRFTSVSNTVKETFRVCTLVEHEVSETALAGL